MMQVKNKNKNYSIRVSYVHTQLRFNYSLYMYVYANVHTTSSERLSVENYSIYTCTCMQTYIQLEDNQTHHAGDL